MARRVSIRPNPKKKEIEMTLGMPDYPEPLELGQVLPGTTGDNGQDVSQSASPLKTDHGDRLPQSRNQNNAAKTDTAGQVWDEWSIDKDAQDPFLIWPTIERKNTTLLEGSCHPPFVSRCESFLKHLV